MWQEFKQYKVGEYLSAEDINRLSAAARSWMSTMPGGNLFGFGHNVAGHERFHQRTVIVVSVRGEPSDVGDEDDQSSMSSSSSIVGEVDGEWPCDTANYRVRPRYHDQDQGTDVTATDDGPYCLDNSGFGDFEVGDILTAWWDAQRGMFRPAAGTSTSPFIRAKLTTTLEPLGDGYCAVSGWENDAWTDTDSIVLVVDGMPGALDTTIPIGTIIYANWFPPRGAYLLTGVPCELPDEDEE